MRTHRQSRRGANAIEFALTAPFFFLLVMGIIDYGYLFASQAGLDNAVSLGCREGAMMDGVVGPSPMAMATTEITNRSAMFCPNGCNIQVFNRTTGIYASPNKTLECRISRNMTPFVGLVPYPAQISSRSFYRLEWQRNN